MFNAYLHTSSSSDLFLFYLYLLIITALVVSNRISLTKLKGADSRGFDCIGMCVCACVVFGSKCVSYLLVNGSQKRFDGSNAHTSNGKERESTK